MEHYEARLSWMPKAKTVPVRVQRALRPFTPYDKGWTIWYEGKNRYVCPKTTPLQDVPDRWEEKKRQIDLELKTGKPAIGIKSLREALSEYFLWFDYRVQNGKPKPLARVTAEDYKRHLTDFARFEVDGVKLADQPLSQFGPEHFRPFAESLADRSPTSFARIVAIVSGFFNYCKDEGFTPALPNFGRYFVRPPQQEIRDRRMQQQKSLDQSELCAILHSADTQELAWFGLALSGAMDNADIAHLTFDVFNADRTMLDYRRRKSGRIPRLIPLHPDAVKWLKDYLAVRPKPADPADANIVFLTPGGLRLQRSKTGKTGLGNHIDYLAHCWDKLLRRAGLRRKPTIVRVCPTCGKLRPARRALCCGQRRWKKKLTMAADGQPTFKGFRSIRTTFANLTPRGFSDERKLIMGHTGDMTLDHYVEKYGTTHLKRLVDEVWKAAFSSPWPANVAVS